MRILFKPRSNPRRGDKITFRSGDTLVVGEEYTAGVSVDGKLATGLVATGDAEKLGDFAGVEVIEADGSGEKRKRKKKRERATDEAKRFLGFGSGASEDAGDEVVDEVGGGE